MCDAYSSNRGPDSRLVLWSWKFHNFLGSFLQDSYLSTDIMPHVHMDHTPKSSNMADARFAALPQLVR